jgi:hypothetical protein
MQNEYSSYPLLGDQEMFLAVGGVLISRLAAVATPFVSRRGYHRIPLAPIHHILIFEEEKRG